ncbi:hypothetical protein GCM10027084_20830 [Pseudoxanthomonas sangjuensis]|uniref:DUF6587 family protein n=1 Tax=Pseudoxanthomonas sangjuensis TaxID=1503750 RepID=UPI001391F7B9|nr:DUF6587 family protein [Pseudoxanthomonas sangjuensis]KAF1715409.1 hypothetical protein CSC71_01645 [Pseudoxanthomonas sangjuensis]
MGASLLLQYIVIALAVIVSAWVVAKKQFPGGVRRLRTALAIPLLREGKPAWLRALGRKVAPETKNAGSGGCGGCNKCG